MVKKQQQFWKGLRVKLKYLLSGLLAFSLTVFVWSAPAQQTSSPTPTLSPKEELIAEIKGYAERHIKTDSSMQTSTVLKLFESNTVGLKAPEIAKIYEEEYSRLKEAKEADPREKIIPKIGWVAAGILAFWVAFQESLKKSLGKLFEVINTAIYNKFAGSKFFQGVALRRYQKALIEKHKELKIPFRSKPLQMQEVYVPLKVIDGSNEDAYRAIAESRRLMIKGAPGAGKSMLLKHITLSYAESGFGQYVPILLELHRLSDRAKSINQYLVEALERDDFPKADRFVAQGLKNGTLLLLFDGLDEVNSAERQQVVQRIRDLIDQCSKCRVLITCRTQVYKGEFNEVVDRTLEVVEFTDQQIQSFLQPWQSSMTSDKSVEQLLRNLHDRPRIMELARNPLMLTIIAYLYTDTRFELPRSRSEFYKKSTEMLLDEGHRDYHSEYQFESRDKKLVLRHLALYNQDSVNHQQQDRRSIDYLTVIAEVKRVLPSLNIDIEKVRDFLKEIVERSGLLLEIDGGERYQFAHLTLQEYFAAAKMIEDEQGLVTRFEKDPDVWREAVKLWCGLAEDSTNIIGRIFDIDKNTAFECLADAQRVDEMIADRIIEDFKVNLAAFGQEDVIAKAFGAVAADIRPRGKAVFNFLAETLATDSEKSRREVAANALSMTNLPEAAKVLAEQYIAHPEAGQPLVRMGDLAVDQLGVLANAGHIHVLDDLNQIGTPKAANSLVVLLWHENTKIANRAAWHLASLLMLPTIEDSLSDCENALRESQLIGALEYARHINDKDEQDRLSHQWIWEPFENQNTIDSLFRQTHDSTLPSIVSSIAYLLKNSSRTDAPQFIAKIDPRIVIPLCSIQMIDKISLPEKLSIDSDALLEQTSVDEELNKKIIKLVDYTLGIQQERSYWRFLLSALEPKIQLKLLYQLVNNRRPNQKDWTRIFQPLKYTFSKSWHYRVILIVAGIVSLIALVQVFYPIVLGSKNGIDWSIAFICIGLLYFWISFKERFGRPFEPDCFVSLGLLGVVTFRSWLINSYRQFVIWDDNRILSNTIWDWCVSCGLVALIASMVGVAGASFISTFALTIAIVEKSFNLVYFCNSKLLRRLMVLVTVLAFPFFCWFPLVAYFSTTALFRFLPWQIVALTWLVIIATCTSLWFRGQQLDYQSRNPLQGLIPNPKEAQGISLKKSKKRLLYE